ncbi:MAG: orotate phosphoribosyltransferase [Deltaproteobacteria bacterium]|nr:MAG: orotate phosphoribosyltransferase [Deltaproteobacteria bacterium]
MEKISEWLLKIGAVTLRPQQPFTWASGIQSPIYCDNRLLLSHPKALSDVIKSFEKLIRSKKIKFDVIAGIATGGIPHAAILSDHLKKPMIYVRSAPKGHGKGNQVEGIFKKGSRVLVIEDLVSTGMSSLNAIEAIRQSGGKVSDCLAVFTYGFPTAQKEFSKSKCKLQTLTTLDNLLPVAQKMKKITEDQVSLILRFSKNPNQWL